MSTKLALLLLCSIGMALCYESSGYGLSVSAYGDAESSGEASGFDSGESSGDVSGFGSGEASDFGSSESSGEASGFGSGESSGEASGLGSGESSGQTTSAYGGSGSSGEGSGESSGHAVSNDDDEGSGLSSGEILQDDLIAGPDGSSIQRLFIKEDGSGHSIEGSFDPLDRIIEDVRIHGSNGKAIRRIQVVQPGVTKIRAQRSAPVEEENLTDGSGDDKKCVAAASCESADDCNGGSCVGFFPGKCNCNACLTGVSCEDDSSCGGLQDACDTTLKVCRCTEAYAKHGFPSLLKAFSELCNVKTCQTGDCLGLPCNKGLCACATKTD